MPFPTLPPQGTTSWYPWAQGVHNAASSAIQASDIGAGNSNDLALRAAFVAHGDLLINVKDYGAKGDGTTDDTSAINAAVSAVSGRGSAAGVVFFPAGTYKVTAALTVARNIMLVGEHAYSTSIRCNASTTLPTFITMGTSGQINTFSGIKTISVDANGKANTALLIYGPQEGSGVFECLVQGGLQYGVQALTGGVAGGTNMFEVDHSWVWTTGDAGIAGLNVTGGLVHARASTFAGVNRTVAAPVGSAGIVVTDGSILDLGCNSEGWESGRRLVRSFAQIISPESYNTLYGVTTSSDSTGSNVFVDSAGWTNSTADINDAGQGVTIPFCLSYRSAGPLSNPRHFLRGWHSYLRGDVYKNDSERTAFGYTSPASGDLTAYKTTILTPSGWIVGPMVDGTDGTSGANSSSWSNAHHRIGNYHLWVDSSGRLRIKNGAPTSDTDGTVVGSQV